MEYWEQNYRPQKVLLWLDDYRDPEDKEIDWMAFSCLGYDCKVFWVKNYDEFVEWLDKNGLPDGVNFDHDLEESHYTPEKYWDDYEASKKYQDAQKHTKTGYHCAIKLVEHCEKHNKELPKWYSHSANPVGRDKINKVLEDFKNN